MAPVLGQKVFLQLLSLLTRSGIIPFRRKVLNILAPVQRFQTANVEFVLRTKYGFKMRADIGYFIEWYIFFYGWYEFETAKVLSSLLQESAVFVDVGANVGFFSLLGASLVGDTGKVIAIEALPSVAKRLRTNLELNNYKNTLVIEKAISGNSGGSVFYVPPDKEHSMEGSLQHVDRGYRYETIQVQSIRLIELLRSAKRVDLIKIDVEGMEVEILHDSVELFRRYRPAIIFEYNKDTWRDGHSLAKIVADLASLAYEFFCLRSRFRRVFLERISLDSMDQLVNIVVVPNEKLTRITHLIR